MKDFLGGVCGFAVILAICCFFGGEPGAGILFIVLAIAAGTIAEQIKPKWEYDGSTTTHRFRRKN